MGFPAEEQARKRMNVTVEFDSRGHREQRTFPTMQRAKTFYTKKFVEGKNPKIVKAGD